MCSIYIYTANQMCFEMVYAINQKGHWFFKYAIHLLINFVEDVKYKGT